MQFYSASFLGDIYEVVAHVSNRYPEANLYAIGWSLGANILVRYLGQVTQLIQFVLISLPPPFCPCTDLPCIYVRAVLENLSLVLCYGELVGIFQFSTVLLLSISNLANIIQFVEKR